MLENKTTQNRLKISLLLLRLGVFIVFFMWTLDKFVNPGHAAAVFAKFYLYEGLSSSLAYAAGTLQLVIVFAFLLGVKKRLSYGVIFLMHLASTVSPFALYFDPWSHLLFFTAWPMLAAIAALYLLREEDTLFTLKLGSQPKSD